MAVGHNLPNLLAKDEIVPAPPPPIRKAPPPANRLAAALARPLRVLAPAFIGALALVYLVADSAPDFEDLALGERTVSAFGQYQGDKIFCGSIEEAPECLGPARERSLPEQVLWLGNSQLHAINQPAEDSVTSPVLLARRLRARQVEVQAMSFPNASLSELWLAWLYHRNDRRIDVLIVPVFLDDTREFGIRPKLQGLAREPEIAKTLEGTAVGQNLLASVPTQEQDLEANASLQTRSEAAITNSLEACCGFQTLREKARGQIEIQMFYFRNWLFNITPQSVRPIIPDRYVSNLAALEAMLADAKNLGTSVILYIPPLRQDVPPPYKPEDYARFKIDTAALANRYGAALLNLDTLVRDDLWGTKAATKIGGAPELDFMHFQGEGHAALASQIAPHVEALLE